MKLMNRLERFFVDTIAPSNKRKRKYLCKMGAIIGRGTRFNCKTNAFGTEPWLISIGEDCLIATDVHFITHDGAIKVLNTLGSFGNSQMDKMGSIRIGNNVYIGMGAYIMPNVVIGDNCIIGARAIVTKDIPSNSVAVGVPAKVIETIDDYYHHCKDTVLDLSAMTESEKKEFLVHKYMK